MPYQVSMMGWVGSGEVGWVGSRNFGLGWVLKKWPMSDQLWCVSPCRVCMHHCSKCLQCADWQTEMQIHCSERLKHGQTDDQKCCTVAKSRVSYADVRIETRNHEICSRGRIRQSAWEYNSAFYPSGVGKWVPAIAGKAKAAMAHSDCGLNVWVCR